MLRVVPSQAVHAIDQLFPAFKNQEDTQAGRMSIYPPGDAGKAAAVLELVAKIPEELLALEPDEYTRLVTAMSVLKNQLADWISRGATGSLDNIPGLGNLNPITIIRNSLALCTDEVLAAESDELDYIDDADLRDNIWGDISGVRRALANQEWKAATVLAGSTIEALLLWSLSTKSDSDIQVAITSLRTNGRFKKKPDNSEKKWNLYEYIYVCQELGLMSENTVSQALLAKDFRNLIHPGRSERLGQNCDRGTAFSAVAGVENVIRDLKNAI